MDGATPGPALLELPGQRMDSCIPAFLPLLQPPGSPGSQLSALLLGSPFPSTLTRGTLTELCAPLSSWEKAVLPLWAPGEWFFCTSQREGW